MDDMLFDRTKILLATSWSQVL